MTETDTKAQGGRKDGSVAADHQVSAAVRETSGATETLPEVSDDNGTSCPMPGEASNGP
ncbi:MAG: hypothetical protein ACOCUY_03320 [Verrucomicrobiota bacterium]